jgi:glycosyltransferase involved in cell wall biosynthesis
VKLSVVVCTRNRAHAIGACLDSIAKSLSLAQPLDAEIVVVDNGSEDETAAVVRGWSGACDFPVNLVHESRKGLAIAHNCGFRAARGELLVFTDDDCRLDERYVLNALRYDAEDKELVLRGGRVELGDPADLPLTIKTDPTPRRWNIAMRSARHECLGNCLHGCNMMMRRALLERVGPWDERSPGDEVDLIYRCYIVGITIEYAPEIVLYHHHGRKTAADGYKALRFYMMEMGAHYAKYGPRDRDLCRPLLWDLRNAAKEIVRGTNTFLPQIGFSHKHRLFYNAVGAMKYWLRQPV